VRSLGGQARVQQLVQQRRRRHEARRPLRAQHLGQPTLAVVRERARVPARAADAQGDAAGLVALDQRAQRLRRRQRLGGRRVEERREMLLGEAGDGVLLEPLGTGVDEHEPVAIAGVGPRRRDLVHGGVVVELLVGEDPHADAVGAHHGQQQGMTLRQPGLARRELLRPR
jgi:hypothetical protein